MPGTLRVQWTIRTSTFIPKPILRCSRCDEQMPFEPSGKFRLNANGKRLDAWLIYRCAACGDTWNRAIFERRRRGEIAAELLERLQCNDAALAEEVARDVAGLARWTNRYADAGDAALKIDRLVLARPVADPDRLVIALSFPAGGALRCDRVLAQGLELSRSRIATFAAERRINVDGVSRKPLARMLREGSEVAVNLVGLVEAAGLAVRAAGAAAAGGWSNAGGLTCGRAGR